jgi:hypothetical protein
MKHGHKPAQPFCAFCSFALRVRAFAAALEALIALFLRSLAVNDLARAKPPWRANSDRACLSSSASMTGRYYTVLARIAKYFLDTVLAR